MTHHWSWQVLQVSDSIATTLTMSTDPSSSSAPVSVQQYLTRTFRLRELFASVRLETDVPEDSCRSQTTNGCSWVFDRPTAMYDRLRNRVLILLRSLDMLYPFSDPLNPSNQGRMYLAVSQTNDVAGTYRLYRISPALSSPASCTGALYPNVDEPVSVFIRRPCCRQ